MTANILESYLVQLGFSVSQPQLRQFQNTLAEAQAGVQKHTAGMAHQLLGWQAAITGAFFAIGGAAIGLMDKVAMADQEYRLFALRMYTSVGAARSLKVALDALGEPLDAIAWDPELHGRFVQLLEDQRVMAGNLGKNYEAQMRYVRDVRFEFTRFGVEMKYLAMQFASSFLKRMGIDGGDLYERLKRLNDWIISHLPQIANIIADHIVPVMQALRDIFAGTWDIAKQLGVAFTNLIGILSGDESLEGTEVSFSKISRAIQDVVRWLGIFIHAILQAENMLLHFLNAALIAAQGGTLKGLADVIAGAATGNAGLAASGMAELRGGSQKWGDVRKELQAGMAGLTPGSGGIVGLAGGSALGASVGAAMGTPGGPLGMALGGTLGSLIGGAAGGAAGAGAGTLNQSPSVLADRARELAKQVSAQTGVPANLIFSQWAHETGGFSNRGATSLNNFGGIRIPGTSIYKSFESLSDFANYYGNLLKSDRYAGQGALKSRTDEDFAGALKRGGYYEDSYQNYVRGMRRYEPQYSGQGSAGTTIGDVNINITHPGATPDQIHWAVRSGISDAMNKQNQRNQAEFAGAY